METFKMSIWGRKRTQGGRLGVDKVKTKKGFLYEWDMI